MKRRIADGSVGSPHVRVGHRQAPKTKTPIRNRGLGFCLFRLWEFNFSPVRPLTSYIHFLGAPQWLFNKSAGDDDANPTGGGQHLHAVISAADSWMDLDESEIIARVLDDVHHVLPASRGLQPVKARTIKEKRATIADTPAAERLRPPTAPAWAAGASIANLLIAGDWTDTGWPATMEGAVRSGYTTAGALLGADLAVEEVPPTWLARTLGLR